MSRPSPWIVAAALIAITLPVALLWRTAPVPVVPLPHGETVAPIPVAVEAPGSRRLFLDPLDPAHGPQAEDAPQLIGIAGRLPDNAVAMVRSRDGKTKVLAPGQSHEGWTLTTLSPDAALFTRGSRRVRSFLAADDPEPEVEAEQ